MIDAENRAAKQRAFYLKLSPVGGHGIAKGLGGFIDPGMDSIEEEMRDSLLHWYKMANSGAVPIIADTAWWMTRFMDKFGRMSRPEAQERSDELTSYAIAAIGLLLDDGILQYRNEPTAPNLVTSTYDPGNAEVTQAILDRLEATLKEDNNE